MKMMCFKYIMYSSVYILIFIFSLPQSFFSQAFLILLCHTHRLLNKIVSEQYKAHHKDHSL